MFSLYGFFLTLVTQAALSPEHCFKGTEVGKSLQLFFCFQFEKKSSNLKSLLR